MQDEQQQPRRRYQLPQAVEPQHNSEHVARQNGQEENNGFQRTACLNCRSVRQRCSRQVPCSRCTTQRLSCRYPHAYNRGRKLGSTNKPETVEKLLARINNSTVRDQVITALLESTCTGSRRLSSLERGLTSSTNGRETYSRDEIREDNNPRVEPAFDDQDSVAAPLRILGAALTTVPTYASTTQLEFGHRPQQLHFSQSSNKDTRNAAVERLIDYFGPQKTCQKDWHFLSAQPINSTFRLEPTACDPITARLIDLDDASLYFRLFMELRNPFAGLFDPLLHTPDFVYSASFTLFSVICALGSAVSSRPRDRIIHPALLSLAESSMKWSIAVSVKSLETIQTIIVMQYWAPICQKQSEDPYWLRINHATRLAKEIGIDKPSIISKHVNSLPNSVTAEFRERIYRNFERTWLYTYIADKSFGLINGRTLAISRRELPTSVTTWWQKPMAATLDRMLSGIVEIRVLLVHVLEQRQRSRTSASSILNWYLQAGDILEQARITRCTPDSDPSSKYLPILAFYMDHNIMVLNCQVIMELNALDEEVPVTELESIYKKTINVASRFMDLVLSEKIMSDLRLGFHNNQCIMICYAVSEIIQTIKRSTLALTNIAQLAPKIKAIAEFLRTIAQELPSSSALHLYLDFVCFLACQFDEAVDSKSQASHQDESNDDLLFANWYKALDEVPLDSTLLLNTDILCWDQSLFDNSDIGLGILDETIGK